LVKNKSKKPSSSISAAPTPLPMPYPLALARHVRSEKVKSPLFLKSLLTSGSMAM
jgi:hypothetical protein